MSTTSKWKTCLFSLMLHRCRLFKHLWNMELPISVEWVKTWHDGRASDKPKLLEENGKFLHCLVVFSWFEWTVRFHDSMSLASPHALCLWPFFVLHPMCYSTHCSWISHRTCRFTGSLPNAIRQPQNTLDHTKKLESFLSVLWRAMNVKFETLCL